MSDYSQPDFYRFNQDSLELVRFILTKISTCQSLLDLGAGSGVIGIELARILKPSVLSLVELQDDYRSHLEHNIQHFLPKETRAEIHYGSFSIWKPETKYDLVVCNPPYYLPGRGQLPDDKRRATARTFLQDDWPALLASIERSLAANGKAFLVFKTDEIIRKTVEAAMSIRGEFFEKGDLTFLELSRLNVD